MKLFNIVLILLVTGIVQESKAQTQKVPVKQDNGAAVAPIEQVPVKGGKPTIGAGIQRNSVRPAPISPGHGQAKLISDQQAQQAVQSKVRPPAPVIMEQKDPPPAALQPPKTTLNKAVKN